MCVFILAIKTVKKREKFHLFFHFLHLSDSLR